jgi:hypothetical protein
MQLLKLFGCANYLRSFIILFIKPLWFIVIIFQQFTCLAIQCNIDVPNTLRSIFTSFERRSLWAKFEFFMFIFTKGLAAAPFIDIRFSLNVVEPPVDTAGGC